MLSHNQLIKHVENLVGYLESYLPLTNSHMVDFFTKSAYQSYIPKAIYNEIEIVGQDRVIDCIFRNDLTNLPNLKTFIDTNNSFTLRNCKEICLNTEQFQDRLKNCLNQTDQQKYGLKLEVFMNSKKSHEVEVLSSIAATIQQITNTTHLLDIGDGKGYLSSMLALHYQIPVLGIDASIINTDGANKRAIKLSKVWNGLISKSSPTKTHNNNNVDLYKQITLFVDEQIDFQRLVENIFLENSKSLGIVGLHTCGNLASTSLKIFNSNDYIKSICNVGCCYHLLTELTEEEGSNARNGFPMSQLLKDRKFKIGRNARMMAAQSIDRILFEKQLPNITIFYRALFEVLIDGRCGENHVGKFRKPVESFVDYTRQALKRLNINLMINDEEIIDLYSNYKGRRNELNVFYLIKAMLAPVIESLILLDRLLFLYENGHENSCLVQLFEPVISPRCYGLIAIKEKN